ncbi:SusC/RagA family TonB-linked outer membrane protein [Bacteroidota bacterium]
MLTNKKIKSFSWYLLGVFILTSTYINAQERSISGTVVSNEDGVPLPGVNIVVKGTSNGASTDFDGNYSIAVSNNNAVLVFSYVGFVAKEVLVSSQSIINVSLEMNSSTLDEVVVVGYGSRKKSDITGSVSSVKSEELNAFPVLSAEQAIQGRAAGVAVQSNNGGEPGSNISVRIRGNTSIGASSAALIVVDGFVGASMPQSADVESIEILKDASATAIYGSRGANGVILVTTKKGRKGKLSVEVNSSFANQSASETIDMLNADQWSAYYKQINSGYVQGTENTDWQNLIYRNGQTSNHQISFSGGSDNVNFYVSGNYFDQKGIVVNSGFERFSFLSNIDAQVSEKLKLGFNAVGSRSTKNGIATQATTGGFGSGDVISVAYRFVPDLGLLNSDGTITTNPVGDEIDNPYAIATETVDETITDRYRANFYANYEIIEGLTFKTTFGFSTLNRTRGSFKPSTLKTSAGAQGGIAAIESRKNSDVLSENYLTYNKEIGKGNFTALGGYSYQITKNERYSAGAQGFITNSVSYRNLGQGAVPLTAGSSYSETEIVSLFGRLNYDYDDKYLITLTGRRDGSSNFAKNEKYAFFPSGALGWKVSNEEFLVDNNTISNLKLRYSYGVTGNPSIAPYQSLASFDDIYAVVGDETVNAVVPRQLSNPNLKWESSYQSNFGVDLGLFDNRISFSADYYNIDTKDVILGDTSAPEYIGFLNPTSLKNIGEINNRGLEFTLTTRNISEENFAWTTDFNWSRNRNKIVKLIDGADIFLDASPGHFLQDETHVLREGESVGQFWGYEYRGVNQGGTLPDGVASWSGDNAAGGELFTDLDGNGEITTADRKLIGDPNQDWAFGLNNTFRYKDFDLSVFFQGAVGGDLFNFTLLEAASGVGNATTEALNVWTSTNTDTNVPSAAVRPKRITSRFVYDGTYVRLKNLALGYNLPVKLVEKLGMDKIRLSVSGQNLLTITDYPGTDPEVSYKASGNQESNTSLGFDYGNYPNTKSVTFSLNLKF